MATTLRPLVPPKFIPEPPKPFLSELREKFAKENPVYLCALVAAALLFSGIILEIVQVTLGIHSR